MLFQLSSFFHKRFKLLLTNVVYFNTSHPPFLIFLMGTAVAVHTFLQKDKFYLFPSYGMSFLSNIFQQWENVRCKKSTFFSQLSSDNTRSTCTQLRQHIKLCFVNSLYFQFQHDIITKLVAAFFQVCFISLRGQGTAGLLSFIIVVQLCSYNSIIRNVNATSLIPY